LTQLRHLLCTAAMVLMPVFDLCAENLSQYA
jgi:hypothetical protein